MTDEAVREIEDTTPVAEPAAPEGETKEEAFKRIMQHRVTECRRYLRLIGNMSARDRYRYTPEQVKQAFDAVGEALTRAEDRFMAAGPKQKDMFRF